jgi:hypothetical protein
VHLSRSINLVYALSLWAVCAAVVAARDGEEGVGVGWGRGVRRLSRLCPEAESASPARRSTIIRASTRRWRTLPLTIAVEPASEPRLTESYVVKDEAQECEDEDQQ